MSNRRRRWERSRGLLIGGSGLVLFLLAPLRPFVGTQAQAPEETNVVPPEYAAQIPAEITERYQFYGSALLTVAKSLGIEDVQGKDLTAPGEEASGSPRKVRDVGIGVHPTAHENEPTVAANPVDKKKMVAGSHFGDRCVAYTSSDRGATWSSGFAMPHLRPLSRCSDPVLAYAPDGSRVYYAYMDIKMAFSPLPFGRAFAFIDLDIVVSYSDDDGTTWTGPIVALDGKETTILFRPNDAFVLTPGFDYDKPWIGTHIDDNQSNWVYVTAIRFDTVSPFGFSLAPPVHIAFTRSSNQGATWSAPAILDSVNTFGPPTTLVQGSRPTGGVGGEVLVAWYHSGTDGWLTGTFQIRTRRSADNGATFDPIVVAANDHFETNFFLGPFSFYHRWWATMFPDVEIDPGGDAHIVYTHDPVQGNATAEEGDIRYVTSGGPPYTVWSPPETVNDDAIGRAQGYAALETAHGGQSSSLHVVWEDHRLSPNLPISTPFQCFFQRICNSPNLLYDMFYARKVPGARGWSDNKRISDVSSISDFIFIGDYNDLTVSNKLFAVWTDRRHQTSTFQLEDNVFGTQIIQGGPH